MGSVKSALQVTLQEEEDDGNVESHSRETRLDEPSAGLVSFARRTFFL